MFYHPKHFLSIQTCLCSSEKSTFETWLVTQANMALANQLQKFAQNIGIPPAQVLTLMRQTAARPIARTVAQTADSSSDMSSITAIVPAHKRVSQNVLSLSELSLERLMKVFGEVNIINKPSDALDKLNEHGDSNAPRWALIKSPMNSDDAVIFTVTDSAGNKICIKAHRDVWPEARLNYGSKESREFFNGFDHVTTVIDVRKIKIKFKKSKDFWLVTYGNSA